MMAYNGKIPWHAYEVKLEHMAAKHNWDDATKVAKLVEALEDKALTFYSTLPQYVRVSYRSVKKKFAARFGPKLHERTARNQLVVLQQKAGEELEEFAERATQVAMDAYGHVSEEMATMAATEAFLHGALEKDAAILTMEKEPLNLDQALELMNNTIQNRRSFEGRVKPKPVRSVTFAEVSQQADVPVRATSPLPRGKQPPRKKRREKGGIQGVEGTTSMAGRKRKSPRHLDDYVC